MIDSTALTTDLQAQVRTLEDDLRIRADEVDEIRALVAAEWKTAADAGRTAHDLETWREGLLTQVAVAWVLGCVFVRFCEDNCLIEQPLLAGPGDKGRQAANARMEFFADHPLEGDRGWLLRVFETAGDLPGLAEVFARHNPIWLFGPSEDAAGAVVEFFAKINVDTGDLVHDFSDTTWNTRFLGDLYQNLSESARKTFALLQTPDFVEKFILDHTLDPAIDEFGLGGFRGIDPACGSGHFLLGMFERLLKRWQEREPEIGNRALTQRALDSVYGVDLNPFAVAIARFRLLTAAIRAADCSTLREAPAFKLHVAVGDSLLHGPAPGQQSFRKIDEEDVTTRHLFATEDGEIVDQILTGPYQAVVANPPYITPKDAAARDAYRRRYHTCYREYALSVPFMERLFDLAARGTSDRPAGFVGQITANSFMKREFGKRVVEDFLIKQIDLTHVVDTSGADIVGHSTPTVVLFGRNRVPSEGVRAVLGLRSDPEEGSATGGRVWQSICSLISTAGAEDEFVSVADVPSSMLAEHPWSLQGGAAPDLKALVDARGEWKLGDRTDVGFGAITGEDAGLVIGDEAAVRRLRLESHRPLIEGDQLRDYVRSASDEAIWPYDEAGEIYPLDQIPNIHRYLWPIRQVLKKRKRFGKPMDELGEPWWSWREVYWARLETSLSIGFAAVTSHNQFVLDRGARIFKQSAPVIKLGSEATDSDHLQLLGLLGSGLTAFWMKQTCHKKTQRGGGGGSAAVPFTHQYDFDGTKLKSFPVVSGSVVRWAELLDQLSVELSQALPSASVNDSTPTEESLRSARVRGEELRRRMVWAQEELDWRALHLYGITGEDLSLEPSHLMPLERGQRAFEILLARRVATGELSTEWFTRHGVTPHTELPSVWPSQYRHVVERRIELIESDRLVNLAERPEYKRRWNWDDWDSLEDQAQRSWLLNRLDDAELWSSETLLSISQVADRARADSGFVRVAELWRRDGDLPSLIEELMRDEAVPYLAAWRFKESGLRKHAAWQRTWESQRREDAGETVGTMSVPPKYTADDFKKPAYKRLRGTLDLPNERFVSYPGAERGDGSPVVGWAGWSYLERARALAGWIEERRSNDGWEQERIIPLLAGVAELVPWLKQWHNEPDPVMGERMGDFFAAYVEAEAHSIGVSPADLAAWRPPAGTRGRKKKA